jgi:hypothetical protein
VTVKITVKVKGLDRAFQKAAAGSVIPTAGRAKASVRVGYYAYYALIVHEDMSRAPRTGQRKYLTAAIEPALEEMRLAVESALVEGGSIEDAAQAAGQKLLEHSLPLVPVDTGYLKESAYVIGV